MAEQRTERKAYIETVRRYYRDNPAMVSSPFGGVDAIDSTGLDAVFDEFSITFDGKSVLDVGCGRGHLSGFVRSRGGSCVGVDLVPGWDHRAPSAFAIADGVALPFREGVFDLVVAVDSFEHFADTCRAAREFRRVLKERGTVFLSTPNYLNTAGLFKFILESTGSYARDSWAPFGNWKPQASEAFLTPGRIRRAFRAAGFHRFQRLGLAREVWAGLFPLIWHARFPFAAREKLESSFEGIQRTLASLFPSSSLHNFWRIDLPEGRRGPS
jgi:SAM-dependent methyltransferase